MMLSPMQRKLLIRYRGFREKPMSFAGQLVGMLPQLLVLGSLAIFSYLAVSPGLGYLVGGMGLGAFLRQASLAWQGCRVVPTLIEVIDWDKVDRLLDEDACL